MAILMVNGSSGPNVVVTWTSVARKPATFPPAAHTHPWSGVTGKPTVFASNWTSVASKPATFPPATHVHSDLVARCASLEARCNSLEAGLGVLANLLSQVNQEQELGIATLNLAYDRLAERLALIETPLHIAVGSLQVAVASLEGSAWVDGPIPPPPPPPPPPAL